MNYDPVLSRMKTIVEGAYDSEGTIQRGSGLTKCVCGGAAVEGRGFRSASTREWSRIYLYCGLPACYQPERLTRIVRMKTKRGEIWADVVRPPPP